ncbi:MAG: type I glyceraldehyde-3-phosphate dehydrogenase, partial [Opitutales bacterium]|nr:type I glyceraldehyde-3-phosphate dehydrogenase [Opitutales bacterium]
MATKIGINGFGRIGRLVFRSLVEKGLLGSEIEVVAINDLVPAENLAYLLKYDTTQGRFKGTVETKGDLLVVNGQEIKTLALREGPAALPWKELGVDIVIECTGLFVQDEKAAGHLEAGAKKVIISAPGKGDGVKTVVIGVNDDELTADHNIISNASCTTNCLAPITKVILENYGIVEGLMTTVHS